MNKDELNNAFKETGKREREALDGLFKEILTETEKVRYSIYHTPDQTRSKYDCLVKQISKAKNEVIKKMFFEVKVRGAYYDTMLLEKQKLDTLKTFVRDLENDRIYYVNFTPRNTIVFDLLKIESEGKLFFVEHNHNKHTVDKEKGKIKKEVAYLDVTDGKVFAFIYNPDPPPPVKEEVADSPTPEDFEAEPFPKDSVALKLPEQTELSIQVVDRKIRLNEDGEIIYSSLEEFKSLPYHLQHRVVYERGIRLFLYTTEDRYEMLAKYGTAERLYKFLKERARQLFLARYGFFVDEPNKYEIKDEN